MDRKKLILYAALFAVSISLWTVWQRDYHPSKTTKSEVSAVAATVKPTTAVKLPQTNAIAADSKRHVNIKTDTLNIVLDRLGGRIIKAELPKYSATINTPGKPIKILNDTPANYYTAESGVVGVTEAANYYTNIVYTASSSDYRLADNQKTLRVSLLGSKNGIAIRKDFIFTRNSYVVTVKEQLTNHSGSSWRAHIYTAINRSANSDVKSGIFKLHTFTGAAISLDDSLYKKLTFAKLKKHKLDQTVTGGWAAMQQRYFLSAWIPDQQSSNRYFSKLNKDIYTVGIMGPVVTVAPGVTTSIENKFYVGPEIAANLEGLAKGLKLTVDYGWLWVISVAIFWLLAKINAVIGNWGWSIIIITVLIKACFYKLSAASYRSMAKMRKLTPHLQRIKEMYGDDRQQMSLATMELYKKERVNPLGGCLPILIQIPVFIGLYYVLVESVELRHAPFILWIQDLSVQDPYYILPVLMGISMFVQQKLSPAPPDPAQAKMMMILPAMMTLFFLSFPAGLVLYWLVNNMLSILQQWYIMRAVELGHGRK